MGHVRLAFEASEQGMRPGGLERGTIPGAFTDSDSVQGSVKPLGVN